MRLRDWLAWRDGARRGAGGHGEGERAKDERGRASGALRASCVYLPWRAMSAGSEEFVAEFCAYTAPAYVYQIPPARSSGGHRAEHWEVNKWVAEVTLKVLTRSDDTAKARATGGARACAARAEVCCAAVSGTQ